MVRTRARKKADDAAEEATARANAQRALRLKAVQVNARQAARERAAQSQAPDDASNQPEQDTEQSRSGQRTASNLGGASRSSVASLNSADARDQDHESMSSGFHVQNESDEVGDVVTSSPSGSRKRRSSKEPESAPNRPSTRRRLDAGAPESFREQREPSLPDYEYYEELEKASQQDQQIVDTSDADNLVVVSDSIEAGQPEQQQNVDRASVDAIHGTPAERGQRHFEADLSNPAASEAALTSDQIWARQLSDAGESSRELLMRMANEAAKGVNDSAKKKADAPKLPLEHEESSIENYLFFQENDEQKRLRRQRYKSQVPQFAQGRTWHGAAFLGEGGMGVAMGYACTDDSNRVIDTVVVKDSWILPIEWSSFSAWDGDLRQYNDPKADVLPWEISNLRRLFMRPGSEHIIRMRGYQVDLLRAHYRIYTEYCDLGTLYNSVHQHVHKRRPFPEDALWTIFAGLVAAIRTLAYGALNPGDDLGGHKSEELEKWRSIIHRDFKPDNIFIQTNRTGNHTRHPVVKLGDFGLSFATTEDDVLNPLAYNQGGGTMYYRAPEHFRWSRSGIEAERNWKLSEATNVWAVGAIMVRLLSYHLRPAMSGGDLDPFPVQPFVDLKAKKDFTAKIIKLAEDCCRFRPNDRISLKKLTETIDKHLAQDSVEQASNKDRRWMIWNDKLIDDLRLLYAD